MNETERVIRIVGEVFGVDQEKLLSKAKINTIVIPRMTCIHILSKAGMIDINIARYFNKNHSTIRYAKSTIENLFDTDKEFRKKYMSAWSRAQDNYIIKAVLK